MKPMLKGVLLAPTLALSACATSPDSISAAYVSPLKYESYDCHQIAEEQASIEERTNVLYHKLKGRHTHDNVMMGVGLFIAWPALLFMHGNGSEMNAEYSQLKGDYDALHHAAIVRQCDLQFASDLAQTVQQPTAPATPTPLPAGATPIATPAMAMGPRRVHANTPSGYCLDVPPSYVGTGAVNMPAVTTATPACSQLSAH